MFKARHEVKYLLRGRKDVKAVTGNAVLNDLHDASMVYRTHLELVWRISSCFAASCRHLLLYCFHVRSIDVPMVRADYGKMSQICPIPRLCLAHSQKLWANPFLAFLPEWSLFSLTFCDSYWLSTIFTCDMKGFS